MKKIVILLIFIVSVILHGGTVSATLTTEQRISDAQAIVDLFEHRYAPAPWKKTLYGIDIATLSEELLSKAAQDITDEEFYTAVVTYLASLKDAHVSSMIPSSYKTTLGFEVDDVGGKVIITHVYRHLLDNKTFPFDFGDRLIAIDGIPVDQLRDELSELSTTGSDKADARLNAMNLTWRDQSVFPIIPEGTAEVTIQPQSQTETRTITIPWTTMGMPLAPTHTSLAISKGMHATPKMPKGPLERLRNIPAVFTPRDRIAQGFNPYASPFPLWPSFEKIEDAPILAGTATIGGKRVAYMKIATFMDTYEVQLQVLKFLARQIPTWEDSTDAMIIDITDNSGGYVCYGDDIARLLISEPIEAPKFQIRPTRPWSVEFEMEMEWTSDEGDRQIIEKTVNEIREALAEGSDLTKPLPICRPDGRIHQASEDGVIAKTYSKPILIMVNELNASAGEIFPATLQDAGRAKVFGMQTMGAGGSVMIVGPIGNSDITLSITESLVWRTKQITAPSGMGTRYIENVGVIPDFPYDVTMDDYLGNYEGYLAALNDAVLSMIE